MRGEPTATTSTSTRTRPACRTRPSTTHCSTKGAAGPKADTELALNEFLSALVRVAFWRLNPTYGQQEKEGLGKKPQAEFTPVPNALRLALNSAVVPNARTDTDGAGFRAKEWKDPQVQP